MRVRGKAAALLLAVGVAAEAGVWRLMFMGLFPKSGSVMCTHGISIPAWRARQQGLMVGPVNRG
jgi:hypothetical protein